jgi:sodium-dependent dicarboxylate transporter 2/3/5
MMLGIAYSASIGGLATLVGTPTNLFFAGFADEQGISIGFARWMLFATPFSTVFLIIAWFVLTRIAFPVSPHEIPGGRELIRSELEKLGSVSRGEWTVLCVFAATATGWIVREPLTQWSWLTQMIPCIKDMNDTLIALMGALILFLIPVNARKDVFALDWKTAESIPWGVLLLFGGGFSLAAAMSGSGLAEWVGTRVEGLAGMPVLVIAGIVATLVICLTELTSNTPTAAAFLPILFGVALGIGADPLLLLVPATLAASCAFMLPVATPPNAIVFGSGHVSIGSMVWAGLWLNGVGILLITLWMYLWGIWILSPGS